MALAATRSNVVVSGISTVKLAESGDNEFVNLPFIRNGKIHEKSVSVPDGTKRNLSHCIDLMVEFEMYAVNNLTSCIELLDSLGTLDFDFQVTAKNGTTWDTRLLTPALGGLKWILDCGGNMDDLMFLKIMLDRRYLKTQQDTIHGTPTSSSSDTPTIAAMGTLAATDIGPAGIKSIEFGAGSYTDLLSNIDNGHFTAELLMKKDQYGRSRRGASIKVDLEADCFQAASGDIADIDTVAAMDVDVRVTLVNGRVFTFDSMLGFDFDISHDADMDDTSFVKVNCSGIVLPSQWDGICT